MKPDYKNWMPKEMVHRTQAVAVVFLVLAYFLFDHSITILLETLRTLKKGGTFAIHDIMSKAKYGDMESFVKKLKDMGYEEVKLVDTTNGMFMSKWESIWMGLSGSAILMGKK